MTVDEAKALIAANVWGRGITCPCCGRKCKVYKRALDRTMIEQLLAIRDYFTLHPAEQWLRTSPYLQSLALERECAKLRFWGLLEEGASGLFRLTQLGADFVSNRRVRVPAFIYEYQDQLLGKSDGHFAPADFVNIHQAAGTVFNLEELLSGAAW